MSWTCSSYRSLALAACAASRPRGSFPSAKCFEVAGLLAEAHYGIELECRALPEPKRCLRGFRHRIGQKPGGKLIASGSASTSAYSASLKLFFVSKRES